MVPGAMVSQCLGIDDSERARGDYEDTCLGGREDCRLSRVDICTPSGESRRSFAEPAHIGVFRGIVL